MQARANSCMGCLAGCGVALLILVVVALALVNVIVAGAQEAPELVCGANDAWFFSQDTWLIWLVPLEDKRCLWGTPDDENSLQRPGRCGWNAEHNQLVVLTHNWYCDANSCPVGVGGVSDIPLLEPGDEAALCEFGVLWRGRVVENVVSHGEVQPQDDFRCGADVCGTIVTSTGVRAYEWGPTGEFVVVRLSYTRAGQ